MTRFRARRGHARAATTVIVAVLSALSLLVPQMHLLLPETQTVSAAPIVRWAWYVTYAKDSFTALQANVGALTYVSPYYFTIASDFTVKNTEEPDTNAMLRNARVKIIPLVKNVATGDDFTPMINTPDAREHLASVVADLVVPRNYDGINVDFEDVKPEDRPFLTDLMARIAAKVHPSGKLVTQAIVGKTSDSKTGYGGAFDYPGLAPSVDYGLFMAYDYHYAGGTPGPVAPINWVRDVTTYAAQTFGAGKVLLGIPLYGYDWDTTSGGIAKAVTYNQALDRAKRPGATRSVDLGSQSEVVRYTDDNGDQHEVWFESAATFDAKFTLVRQAGVAGFGLWRIGQEDSGVWDVLKRTDIPTARSPRIGDDTDSRRYFPETGHNLLNGFKQFWEANGGLAQFGYPLTDEYVERNPVEDKTYTVQYFERARLEWHADTSTVMLGKVGQELFNAHGKPGGAPINPPANLTPDKQYFPETHHMIAGGFKQYWDAHKALLGLPISEETAENGKTVQYFEFGRLEFNPAGTTQQDRVQVGLVGTDTMRARGWIP